MFRVNLVIANFLVNDKHGCRLLSDNRSITVKPFTFSEDSKSRPALNPHSPPRRNAHPP